MWKIVKEWQNNKVTEWPSDQVTKWPSDQVTKWPSDRVTEYLSDWVTEWLNDQMVYYSWYFSIINLSWEAQWWLCSLFVNIRGTPIFCNQKHTVTISILRLWYDVSFLIVAAIPCYGQREAILWSDWDQSPRRLCPPPSHPPEAERRLGWRIHPSPCCMTLMLLLLTAVILTSITGTQHINFYFACMPK